VSEIDGIIDKDEAALDRLFAAVPPVAPPVGFRDAVMHRIRGRRGAPALEWALAGALALPSLAFLMWETISGALGVDSALASVMTISASTADSAFFFVDGIVVVAFALLGLGALVGSHALTYRS
jgi:hypothetical protein